MSKKTEDSKDVLNVWVVSLLAGLGLVSLLMGVLPSALHLLVLS